MRGGKVKVPATDVPILVQARVPKSSADAIQAKIDSGEFASVAHYLRVLITRDLKGES